MIASSEHFKQAVSRIQEFFKNNPLPNTLDWRFVNDKALYEERKIRDSAFDKKARISGGEASSSGLDIFIFNKDKRKSKSIRIKTYISPVHDGRYALNYNFPTGINSIQECLQFLSVNDVYFLVIRKQRASTIFWLERYDNYPEEAWTARKRHKRIDTMELKKKYAIKKFNYISNFEQMILTKISHENKQRKFTRGFDDC
jgi:hypothetical protein